MLVIVDDPAGPEWATNHGLDSHGLLWILGELRRSEIIPAIRPLISRLRERAYRLPQEETDSLLREFNEGYR
jgi:predicted nucleic acid-binding protein